MSRRFVFCTQRQFDVVAELVRDGADNRTIADRLVVVEDTVKSHMKVLLRKAGTKDRTALAVGIIRGHIAVVPPGSGAAHEF